MSTVEIPFFTIAGQNTLKSQATSGSNPWVDGVFYEGQWGRSIHIAFNQEIPVYSYYFLKPNDIDLADQTALGWTGSGDKQGIAGVSDALANVFKRGYESISDVSLLQFKQEARSEDANVWIANAYFANRGSVAEGTILGSHNSLVNLSTGVKSATPILQTMNAFVVELEEQNNNLGPGSSIFATIVHEAGHGIGQSHPHDTGLGGAISGMFPGLVSGDAFGRYGTGLYGLTQTPFTIMSYKRGYTNKTITDTDQLSIDNAITPMALDVAAIQIKYGTNRETRKGDTSYVLNPKVWQCIYDAGGEDWMRAPNDPKKGGKPRNAYLNLRPAEMNAIRPHSGEPMEAYRFGLGEEVDFAINTLISAQTSMIGAPLGMGTVFAMKVQRVFDGNPSSERELALVNDLASIAGQLRSLEKQGINCLQLLTSVKQYMHSYAFDALPNLSVQKIKEGAPDFQDLPDGYVALIRDVLAESSYFANTIEDLYKESFIDASGPESYIADLSRLQDIQQQLLERSAKGIAGYPSFVEGLNGGFTIAAGVLIENAEGGAGNDQIIGNAENNILLGQGGQDILEGYLGADRLTGGSGADVFVYANSGDSLPALEMRDTITDFAFNDRVSLKQLRVNRNQEVDSFSDVLPDDFQFKYIGFRPFSGQAGEVRFASSVLSLDLDGDAATDMAINLPGVLFFRQNNLIL